jgi:hypothetical protein
MRTVALLFDGRPVAGVKVTIDKRLKPPKGKLKGGLSGKR